MYPIRIPKHVAEAFDYFKRVCPEKSTRHLTLMAIPFSATGGFGKVLRDFASQNPTVYLESITNGYEPIINVQDEVRDMLSEWMKKPYEESEERDIERFAGVITKYFQQQT